MSDDYVDGYILMPIEPTVEMLQAMRNVIEMSYNNANYAQMYKERHAYKALLVAANVSVGDAS